MTTRADVAIRGPGGNSRRSMALFTQALRKWLKICDKSYFEIEVATGIRGLGNIAVGKRPPPLDKMGYLATALGITDPKEIEEFYVLALVAQCPVELEPVFYDLFKRTKRLEQQLSEYDAKVAETGSHDRKELIQHMERLKAENDQLRAENAALKKSKRH